MSKFKHTFVARDYPLINRKDGYAYEASADFMKYWLNGSYASEVGVDFARLHAVELAHNVREAYPDLTIASYDLTIPVTLTVQVEGRRLSAVEARQTAVLFVSSLQPTTQDLREYAYNLKETTGQTLRNVRVTLAPPQPVVKVPTSAEVEAAREVSSL